MRTSRFRSNRWLVAAATVVSLTALTACGSSDGDSNSDPNAIVVGSANFTESETIANIYAEALRVNGFDVSTSFNVGSREAYIPALKDGSISVIPDYTGNLLQYLDPDSTATSSADVLAALPAALGSELAIATPASAEDKDAVVVTKETADKWNLKTIADLAPHFRRGQVRCSGRVPGTSSRIARFEVQLRPRHLGSQLRSDRRRRWTGNREGSLLR